MEPNSSCCRSIKTRWNSYDDTTRKELKEIWITALVLTLIVATIAVALHFTIGHYTFMKYGSVNDLLFRVLLPTTAFAILVILGISCCIPKKYRAIAQE